MTPVATTALGQVAGTLDGDVTVFRGMPYAVPPVGPLRWQAPQPLPAWEGVRPATSFGSIAPQERGMLDHFLGSADHPTSEDCLTLNVWTPGCDDGRRPVMVWIHGGAFTAGCGSAAWFDGASLARRGDVVVVTLNYRLGALGFTAFDARPGSGNLGLLDQMAALRWVRDNIGGFGGDANRVTVFGESAGGASVVALLAAPAANGLFQRAVVQSASFTQLREGRVAARAAGQLLDELGHPSDLTSVPTEEVRAAQARVLRGHAAWFTAFSPVADGIVLPDTVGGLLGAAARNPVPVVLGTTRDELQLFTAFDPALAGLDAAGLEARAAEVLGEAAPAAVARYRAARPGASPGQLASAIATDHGFRMPAIGLAEARVRSGSSTWMYLFTWPTPVFGGILGACHGLELPFVFHNLHQQGVTLVTGAGPEREELAGAMSSAWLGFASAGDPGWAPFETETRPTMRFDVPSTLEHDPDGDLRRVWTGMS